VRHTVKLIGDAPERWWYVLDGRGWTVAGPYELHAEAEADAKARDREAAEARAREPR
jgi:hypothetical protein